MRAVTVVLSLGPSCHITLTVFSMWMGKKYLCADSLTQGEKGWLWTYLRLIGWGLVGMWDMQGQRSLPVSEAFFQEKKKVVLLDLDFLSSFKKAPLYLACLVFSLERFVVPQNFSVLEFQEKSTVSQHVSIPSVQLFNCLLFWGTSFLFELCHMFCLLNDEGTIHNELWQHKLYVDSAHR